VFRDGRLVLEEFQSGSRDLMRFRLIFRGHLPAKIQGSIKEKHDIRRQFHPQLRELWNQHPALVRLGGSPGRVDDLAHEYEKWGFRFVPLVREENEMACSLNIVLMRRGEPHRVFDGTGDLDNRVKNLIDALCMPSQRTQVDGLAPNEDEDPFFCLMEDDKLIYDFKVETDRLLAPSEPNEPERDVFALIEVRVVTWAGGDVTVPSSRF
jgi:hypothetical protein